MDAEISRCPHCERLRGTRTEAERERSVYRFFLRERGSCAAQIQDDDMLD